MSLFQIDVGKERGGEQRQSFLLANELKRNGYSLQFVTQPGSLLYQKATDAGLPVFPMKTSRKADALSILRLSLAMKRKKCRLVHFHDVHSMDVGFPAASLAKVPVRVISRRVDFPLKKKADAIIAISEDAKKVLVEGGIDAQLIHIIPDGIDFAPYEDKTSKDYLRQEFSFSPDDFLVGFAAQLSDDKGHMYLIQVARHLRESAPKIKIIILGKGPLHLELNKQVKEFRGEDMVFFLGFWEYVPQIFNSLDVFVLSSNHESMGSIIMDAMACRLPIVATRVGRIPGVIDHQKTGLLVPPQRPRSLANAILKMYEDRELAHRLGQKGYDVVHQKFSMESMASKAINLYEELAKKKGVKFLRYL